MDSELLAGVYVELLGERQATLGLATVAEPRAVEQSARRGEAAAPRRCPRV